MTRLLPPLLTLLSALLLPLQAAAREVSIPITLDYQLLDALLLRSSYTDPGNTAQLLNEGDGCLELTLSEPHFSGTGEAVTLASRVYLHAGTPFGDTCLMPYQWHGSVEVSQRPRLNPENWELHFETVGSRVLSAEDRPHDAIGAVLDRLLPMVNTYLQDFSVDLGAPVDDLRALILPLFTAQAQSQAEQLLRSMRPGPIAAGDSGLTVTVLADAVAVEGGEEKATAEHLSEAEMDAFLDLWETWDSLLVYLISMLCEQPLTAAEKQELMDLLLETRYEFVARVNEPAPRGDFVRDQFVAGWGLLSRIFKRHLLHDPASAELGYLSFITATDALMVLDELGPAFGIEISRNGLVRLARILGGETVELRYTPDLNGALQQLFEISPETSAPPQEPSPALEKDPNTSWIDMFRLLDQMLLPSARAAAQPSFAEIKKWQPPGGEIDDYLDRVRKVLDLSLTAMLIRRELPASLGQIYQRMIPAIAWQESCFRQFVVNNDKLTYLLSYNNSSVGLMQVNERVWRGLYDNQRLRWDIQYNAEAGCEIANLYLQKYALPKYGEKLLAASDLLAELVYAMYNGGPSQYDKYLARKKSGKPYDSDRLFAQKYSWVTNQAWDNAGKCF